MTSLWRTSRTWAERRTWRVTLALLLLALAAALLFPNRASGQAGAIVVRSDSASAAFSDALTFTARVEASTPLEEAVLLFGRVGVPLVRRVYPEFRPGRRVTLEYVEPLEPGQFAPGTVLRYWYELRAADGATLRTPEQTFTYVDDRFRWEVLSGPGVDVYYYGRQAARARDLADAAEVALERLQEEMGVPLEGRVSVYAYANQRDMRPALASRSESYDDRVLTLGVAVDEYTLLLLADHRDAEATLAHELSHIVAGIATDNPFTDLPRWLDEGLAMYAEGALPSGNRVALEVAVEQDDLLSLRSMTSYSGRASDVDLFYAQAYSVVEYMLREYGQDRMRALLGVFAEGALQDAALQSTYGLTLEELEDAWREDLGLAPRPRATRPAAATPQPTLGG